MKEIRKKFKLIDFLRGLGVGEECIIHSVAYKPSVVRCTVNRLNEEKGGEYTITEKGLQYGSKVTRLS